jgi:hypothetical protein
MRAYNETISPYRQSEKQRQSSMIAESKWGKRNPLQDREKNLQVKLNSFSQQIMMNRYLMKTANFNTLNTIPDYANSMYEVILKQRLVAQ